MSDEYLLAAKAMEKSADSLEAEVRKMRNQAAMYRRRAVQETKAEKWRREGRNEFNRLTSLGFSRYGAALHLCRQWNVPIDSVLQHIFFSEKMAVRARREMRNDHVVRLHTKGLSNARIARHSAVVRLNEGEPLHPNSIPRIVRLTREKGAPPTRLYNRML